MRIEILNRPDGENILIAGSRDAVMAVWNAFTDKKIPLEQRKTYIERYILLNIANENDALLLVSDSGKIEDRCFLKSILKGKPFSEMTVVELLEAGHIIRIEKEDHNIEIFKTIQNDETYSYHYLSHYENGDQYIDSFPKNKLDEYIGNL